MSPIVMINREIVSTNNLPYEIDKIRHFVQIESILACNFHNLYNLSSDLCSDRVTQSMKRVTSIIFISVRCAEKSFATKHIIRKLFPC